MDLATMRRRAELIGRVRAFFAGRGYLEVDTPLAAPALIPEPAIEVFPVRWLDAADTGHGSRELYLVPSPELWMKRLVAAGSGDIFQICHCFRNVEESGPHHAPEFCMLEWYTLGATYADSADLTAELLEAVGLRRPLRRESMAELFRSCAGLDLGALAEVGAFRAAAGCLGIALSPDADWEECFHKVFLTFVEPALAGLGAVLVMDYPAAIPTLARRKAGTPWAERWELYLDGVELANCYTEETDGAALRALLAAEAERKKVALVPHPPDLAVAELVLPPCSGVALGLDRLVAVAIGRGSVEEVIFYPRFGIL